MKCSSHPVRERSSRRNYTEGCALPPDSLTHARPQTQPRGRAVAVVATDPVSTHANWDNGAALHATRGSRRGDGAAEHRVLGAGGVMLSHTSRVVGREENMTVIGDKLRLTDKRLAEIA